MKEWWRKVKRDYFTFPSGERNGLLVLLAVILFAAFYPQLISHFNKDKPPDFSDFQKDIDSFQKYLQAQRQDSLHLRPSVSELDQIKNTPVKASAPLELFVFDPNTAAPDEFKRLGLKEKLITTIINYRNKGGKFFVPEDIKKIYGLKEKDYSRLAPYIQITSQKKNDARAISTTIPVSHAKEKNPQAVDLNKADSAQLVALPGIGSILSSRIIKFRTRLGGFYSTEQLSEVYGLTPETLDALKDKISVNPAEVTMIKINTAELEELKQHPYFRSDALVIIRYREQHGDFVSVEDLKNIDAITEEEYLRMKWYVEL
ncbi:MAG: helix-hairpin-helix domain-containing protein [Chitinophagales bacterium]